MKFNIPTENIHVEGTMSHFDIGPRFCFMKSRIFFMENKKIFPFLDIKIKQDGIFLNFETGFPPNECYKHAGKVSK